MGSFVLSVSNVWCVKATGCFQAHVTLNGKPVRLPPVRHIDEASQQVVAFKELPREQAARWVDELFLSRKQELQEDILLDHPRTYLDGGFPRGFVVVRDVPVSGPKRRNLENASLDARYLTGLPPSAAENAVAYLMSAAPPCRDLPAGVTKNRQGKFFAALALPGKTQVYGPAVESLEEALEHAQGFLSARKRGVERGEVPEVWTQEVKRLKAEYHEETQVAKGSFTEAKGSGWQPKNFSGSPYYERREDAVCVAQKLRRLQESGGDVAALIKDEQDSRAAVNELDRLAVTGAGAQAETTPAIQPWMVSATERPVEVYIANTCVPSADFDASLLSGKVKAELDKLLASRCVPTHVSMRACECPRTNGFCEPFSAGDKAEAQQRLKPFLRKPVVVVGKAFPAVAYALHQSKTPHVALPHFSRWTSKTAAGRAARLLNAFFGGTPVVSASQLHDLAVASRSAKQLENCAAGRMGWKPEDSDDSDDSGEDEVSGDGDISR
jgi:hypothetical protein